MERKGKVDFLAKFVRKDKIDGKYLDGDPIWLWRPNKQTEFNDMVATDKEAHNG